MLSSLAAKPQQERELWSGLPPIVARPRAIWYSRARVKQIGGATAERYSPNPYFGTPHAREGDTDRPTGEGSVRCRGSVALEGRRSRGRAVHPSNRPADDLVLDSWRSTAGPTWSGPPAVGWARRYDLDGVRGIVTGGVVYSRLRPRGAASEAGH